MHRTKKVMLIIATLLFTQQSNHAVDWKAYNKWRVVLGITATGGIVAILGYLMYLHGKIHTLENNVRLLNYTSDDLRNAIRTRTTQHDLDELKKRVNPPLNNFNIFKTEAEEEERRIQRTRELQEELSRHSPTEDFRNSNGTVDFKKRPDGEGR